ncbi:cupredoxin domain-containing protein [Methylobacterium oxalidis]|uniref:Amicyanin n=1 Tax=Methylobacterium oxalidis TaxID=944322 RepID=A0A512J0B6_9HYPH|nr:cupredoxin family copper-binding protein [Methylobacterium oxalidis]GEP03414.1 amicyanin [Methylobacterium oxalidis]GJE30211.1 Plastocyanin [Methylobacterium oxalidis]GLS63381.1 amicyanin [Methylobacterium oxalidis]
MPSAQRLPRRLAGCGIAAIILQILAFTPATAAADRTLTDPVIIRIDNFTFAPQALTVAPGTRVTWVNGDDIPHTVVAQNKLFRSKTLDTDDRFTFTFQAPGEYAYFCSLHPHMTGTVVVKASTD